LTPPGRFSRQVATTAGLVLSFFGVGYLIVLVLLDCHVTRIHRTANVSQAFPPFDQADQ